MGFYRTATALSPFPASTRGETPAGAVGVALRATVALGLRR